VVVHISKNQFLLITATGSGFWQEMHHVLEQLLKAELTGRIPVVYWGRNCMYGIPGEFNAFERFFLPVSGYTVHDLADPGLTWSPPGWNYHRLVLAAEHTETPETAASGRADTTADVLVCTVSRGIEETARLLPESHPLYGLNERALNGFMLEKYVRLQPGIQKEIDTFYEEHLANGPVLAVHIRGSDKISEVAHLEELNRRYPDEINKYLAANPAARIFLMTDCRDILAEYKSIYGDRLINTDCKRVLRHDMGVHFQPFEDEKRKGIEIIKDTWLASKCDFFIGNAYSNVSRAVSELKFWEESAVMLLR
jgi:hypothetical protein